MFTDPVEGRKEAEQDVLGYFTAQWSWYFIQSVDLHF